MGDSHSYLDNLLVSMIVDLRVVVRNVGFEV